MSDSFLSIYFIFSPSKKITAMNVNEFLPRTFAKANWKFVYSSILYHMIAFIYVTSKPPSGHKMRNKSTKSPDRNRLNVIKCKTTETFQTFYRNTNMVFYTNNVP